MNSWRYSCKKLGLVFPSIFFNSSFAEFQLPSALWVCVPVIGSTKWREWFTVKCIKPRFRLAWLYAAQLSVCKIDPGETCRPMIGKRAKASLLGTSWRYGREGGYSGCQTETKKTRCKFSEAANSQTFRKGFRKSMPGRVSALLSGN